MSSSFDDITELIFRACSAVAAGRTDPKEEASALAAALQPFATSLGATEIWQVGREAQIMLRQIYPESREVFIVGNTGPMSPDGSTITPEVAAASFMTSLLIGVKHVDSDESRRSAAASLIRSYDSPIERSDAPFVDLP